jgi:hypothetical protein
MVCYHHFRVLTRGLAGSFQPTLLDASSWCSFTSLPVWQMEKDVLNGEMK